MERLKPLLLSRKLTLAAAESLTTGRVQALIGSTSGASGYFLGGITAYTLEAKVRHLGVDRVSAKRTNGVSAQVAEQMARGVCMLFGSDIGIATTGYAEPAPSLGVGGPFAWWAIVHRAKTGSRLLAVRSGRIECPGAARTGAQAIVAEAALGELVAYLEEI